MDNGAINEYEIREVVIRVFGSVTASKAKEITHERHPHRFGNHRCLVCTPEVHLAKTWSIHLTGKFLSGDKQS